MKDLIRHILKEETEDNLKNLAIEDMNFAMEIAGGFENIIKKTNPTEKEIDEMITCYLDQNLYPDYNWGPDLFDFYKNEVKTYGFVDFYINDDVAYIYWANDKGRTPNSIEFVDESLIKFMNKTFKKRWIGPFKKWFEKNSDLKVNDIYLGTSSDTPENLSLNENTSKRKKNVFYGFENLPNHWTNDYENLVSDRYFEGKDYEDFYFDNFYDMDLQFGHEQSLFGTRGLPVGHPDRSSRSFDSYNQKYGPMIVRVVKNKIIEESNKSNHIKDKEVFQYMVDFIIEEMREICNKQDAENVEDLISFDACDFLLSKTKIEVTSFDYYNERPRILIHIKYLNTRYLDEEPFIGELQWRLKRWIGDNIVQIEDITYS